MTPAAVVFIVTAYGLGCDAPNQVTAAGVHPAEGWTIAADPAVLPIGSIVHIDGLGQRMVQDKGRLVRGNHLDVFMESCKAAGRWGRKERRVRVLHRPQRSKR